MNAFFLPTSLPLNCLSFVPAALSSPLAHALPAEGKGFCSLFFPAFCRHKCLGSEGLVLLQELMAMRRGSCLGSRGWHSEWVALSWFGLPPASAALIPSPPTPVS